MKVHIEMDMTPEEARAFLGLPDLAPLQQKMLDEMRARMRAAFDKGDAKSLMQAWMPAGQAKAFEEFQKMLWDSPPRKDKP